MFGLSEIKLQCPMASVGRSIPIESNSSIGVMLYWATIS